MAKVLRFFVVFFEFIVYAEKKNEFQWHIIWCFCLIIVQSWGIVQSF